MSKKNKKTIKKNKNSSSISNRYPTSGDFYTICKNFLSKLNGADYCFAIVVISKEESDYVLLRQSILGLISFNDSDEATFIQNFLKNKGNLECSEKLNFLKKLSICEGYNLYYSILKEFISASTSQQIDSLLNCFMGKATKYSDAFPMFNPSNLSMDSLNLFYESIHRTVLEKSSRSNKLKELTFFIFDLTNTHSSQSLLFFMSFFSDDKNKKIEFANNFLEAENYAIDNTTYLYSLANNIAYAATDIGDFDEAEFWLEKIDDITKKERIIKYILSEMGELEKKHNHPLNPDRLPSLEIDDLSTGDLIYLSIFLDGCGGDWGFKRLKQHGHYLFPFFNTSIEKFKILAMKGVIKLSRNSFNSINEENLDSFDSILEDEIFHLNIIGVSDTKNIALKIVLEEIERREDKNEFVFNIWKEISLDYFYSTLNYCLNNVNDSWVNNFTLNEKTIKNLYSANLSAKVFSYIARSSSRYTAGKHVIGDSTGNRHTCNTLISSINKNLEWISSGQFIDNSYPRSSRQPVLSSESILEKLIKIDVDDLYNISPNYGLISPERTDDIF